jgi:hypothetical protein
MMENENRLNFDDLPDVVTADELSRLLGLSKSATYDALGRGEIPGSFRVGRKIMVMRDDLVRGLRALMPGSGGRASIESVGADWDMPPEEPQVSIRPVRKAASQ